MPTCPTAKLTPNCLFTPLINLNRNRMFPFAIALTNTSFWQFQLFSPSKLAGTSALHSLMLPLAPLVSAFCNCICGAFPFAFPHFSFPKCSHRFARFDCPNSAFTRFFPLKTIQLSKMIHSNFTDPRPSGNNRSNPFIHFFRTRNNASRTTAAGSNACKADSRR